MANYKLVNSDKLDSDMKTVADKIREKAEMSDSLIWPSGFVDGIDQCSSLNFSVVSGTTQPSDPKDNTIWVNTSNEITGWIFSATEPENPSEGMVWISTGTTSTVEFNALKKNGIQVYPLSAKQYVSGAWVDVTAMSYQGGSWKEWLVYLYRTGDTCDSVTGGWHSPLDGTILFYGERITNSGAKITFNADNMYIKAVPNDYATWMITANGFDMTDYSTLMIEYTHEQDYNYEGKTNFVVVSDEITDIRDSNWIVSKTPQITSTRVIESIDISTVDGICKFAVLADLAASFNVYNIWLE